MRPTSAQEQLLNRMAGARRFVWNWALSRWKSHYKTTGKSISLKQLMAELTQLKRQPDTAWLAKIDSQALQQVLRDLHAAFTGFFEKRSRYPKFKSRKKDRARFRIPQRVKIVNGQVYVPTIGWVRIFQSQPVDLPTKSATFKRDAKGHWFVTLTAEFEMPDVPLPEPDRAKTAGIDLGLIAYATLSDGSDPIPAPKFYRKSEKAQRRAQRAYSRRKNGSRRKAKAKAKLNRIQQKAANQRKDFLHKTTTPLVNDHDAICIEDLSLKGLARTKLAKSFLDAAMGEFRRQLNYKCLWNRKHLIVVDKFFPSSKMCSHCGMLNHALTLSDREWVCPQCEARHRRDFNAAVNIRDEGLRILAVGQTERLNAQGDRVRPATVGCDC